MKKNKKPGTLFVLFIILIGVVLTWFFVVAEDYYDYAGQTIESSAQIAPVDKEELVGRNINTASGFDPEIKYRNFFITAPGAQRVELLADFNQWGKTPIVLKAYSRGYFETSVALTSGEYKYVFSVDGKDVLDPLNKDRIDFNGREVCIKTVR